jgi:hypothetical protein
MDPKVISQAEAVGGQEGVRLAVTFQDGVPLVTEEEIKRIAEKFPKTAEIIRRKQEEGREKGEPSRASDLMHAPEQGLPAGQSASDTPPSAKNKPPSPANSVSPQGNNKSATRRDYYGELGQEVSNNFRGPHERKAYAIRDAVVPLLDAFDGVFPGGVELATKGLEEGAYGLAYDRKEKSLVLDIDALARYSEDVSPDGRFDDSRIRAAFSEELIHFAALEVIRPARAERFWQKLGQSEEGNALRQQVEDAYFAKFKNAGKPYPARSGEEMTHEFVRMMVQDEAFARKVTETRSINTSFDENIQEMLQALVEKLRELLGRVDARHQTEAQAMRNQVIKKLGKLGVTNETFEAARVPKGSSAFEQP